MTPTPTDLLVTPMSEVVLEPAKSSTGTAIVGEAEFFNSDAVPTVGAGTNQVGKGVGLDSISDSSGVIAQFDTSSIPLGSVVNKAKFLVKGAAADSIGTSLDVSVHNGESVSQADYRTHAAEQISYKAETGDVPPIQLWDDYATASSSAPHLIWQLDNLNNVGSWGQAWTANNPNSKPSPYQWFKIGRSWSSGAVFTNLSIKIYTAIGIAGSYRKGSLVASSVPRGVNELSTSPAWFYFFVGNDFVPQDGETYVTELVMSGATYAGKHLTIYWARGGTPGSSDNMSVYAKSGTKLQGFRGTGVNFAKGSEIASLGSVGTTDTGVSFPSFSSLTVYSFGSSDYSTSLSLSNFKNNIQAALNARSLLSDWIAVRIQNFSETTDGAMRQFLAQESTTATTGSLHGMVLSVDFTEPELDTQILAKEGLSGKIEADSGTERTVSGVASVGPVLDGLVSLNLEK